MNYSVDWDGPGERDRDPEDYDHTKEQLITLLNERDEFICEKGLWSEFVAWLVSSQRK